MSNPLSKLKPGDLDTDDKPKKPATKTGAAPRRNRTGLAGMAATGPGKKAVPKTEAADDDPQERVAPKPAAMVPTGLATHYELLGVRPPQFRFLANLYGDLGILRGGRGPQSNLLGTHTTPFTSLRIAQPERYAIQLYKYAEAFLPKQIPHPTEVMRAALQNWMALHLEEMEDVVFRQMTLDGALDHFAAYSDIVEKRHRDFEIRKTD